MSRFWGPKLVLAWMHICTTNSAMEKIKQPPGCNARWYRSKSRLTCCAYSSIRLNCYTDQNCTRCEAAVNQGYTCITTEHIFLRCRENQGSALASPTWFIIGGKSGTATRSVQKLKNSMTVEKMGKEHLNYINGGKKKYIFHWVKIGSDHQGWDTLTAYSNKKLVTFQIS